MPSEELFFSELIEVTLITSIPKLVYFSLSATINWNCGDIRVLLGKALADVTWLRQSVVSTVLWFPQYSGLVPHLFHLVPMSVNFDALIIEQGCQCDGRVTAIAVIPSRKQTVLSPLNSGRVFPEKIRWRTAGENGDDDDDGHRRVAAAEPKRRPERTRKLPSD
ncbi:unnamed protein product [Heligmosomoides polygyrus]|uniref:Uncharacterized protein n=1 Tax=Heligmosomoides polygyrus TaxID=6339 RepID=A0A183G0I1_HELPZ|nr:unnamed protein product [Heligmosomoides polygyrus]